MGRKAAWAMALGVIAVVSAGLVGGQVGGFLWWGTHEPIYIYGDDDFTYDNGVLSGSGTAADPYILEGWSITPANADYGVYVDHTTSHFVIRDCMIAGARIAGVYLNSVQNGRVVGVEIADSDAAVYLLNARGNRIEGSVIRDCRYGAVMAAMSQGNVVTGCTFLDNGLAAYDPQGWNTWFDGKTGNYWSDYEGVDANNDGVGDEPYYPLDDARPLMAPPVAVSRGTPAGPSYAGNLVAPDGSLVVTSQTPITLTAADLGSGLAEIKYSIDGGAWTTYTGPLLLKGDDGPRKVTYYGVDKLGNTEAKKTVAFLLDNHAPKTTLDVGAPKFVDGRGTWITSETRITLQRTQESTYGRAETYYQINDGNWLRYNGPFRITGDDGARVLSFYSRNASGVVEAIQSTTLLKDDAPPTSRGAKAGSPTGVTVGATPSAASATPVAAPVATTPATVSPTTPAPAATAPKPATTPAPAAAAPPSDQSELSGAALGQAGAPKPVQTESTVTPPAPSSTQTPSSTTTQTPSQTVPSS